MKVAIVDYGMGNILSLVGALNYLGVQHIVVTSDHHQLADADRLILPGVGSFAKAMQVIKEKNLHFTLHDLVVEKKKPILGICLGMQLMGLSSTEHGQHAGLGWVRGEVTKFNKPSLKVPHVGFDQVIVNHSSKLYNDMHGEIDFYFTHSFKMHCDASINQNFCNYGDNFVASFECEHIAGVQFHPELSQQNGLHLMQNFITQF